MVPPKPTLSSPEFFQDMNTTLEQPATAGTHRKHLVSLKTDAHTSALTELRSLTEQLLPHFGDLGWNRHSMVTHSISSISRVLYLNQLYSQIVNVPGVICEFGVQWGATLAQLINLRAIHEPFNHSRTICGFDTFSGFPAVHAKDGGSYRPGDLATLDRYEETLERILTLVESFPPQSHIKKFELIKGDACTSIDGWLEANPHAIVSLVIFDMDLYEPTKVVLEKIRPRLTKGSVIAFDELNCKFFPGETRALDEVLGLNHVRLQRSPLHPYCSWATFGG